MFTLDQIFKFLTLDKKLLNSYYRYMGIQETKYRWIYTDGGPLILVSKKHISSWKGTGTDLNNQPSGDYERACGVSEWIGKIPVGEGSGIVLGGDEYQAAWKENGKNSGLIVRWGSANSEDDVISSLEQIPEDIWGKEAVTFKVDGELKLFVSAEEGEKAEEYLNINLDEGDYKIFTAEYKPNPDTELILHKFQKLP